MNPKFPQAQMSRRKFLYTTGLAAATTSALSACGGFAGEKNQTGTQAGGPRSLFTGWGSDIEKKNVSAATQAFDSGRPAEQQIPYQFIANDGYDAKMNTLVAANQLPSLSYQNEGTAMRLGAQGHLSSVLDHVDKYPELKDLLPGVVHRWAPGQAVAQLAVEMFMMWYNATAFEEAGVPAPPTRAAEAWTWDEYVGYCDKLTFDTSGRHPSEPGYDPKHVKQFGTLAPTSLNAFYGLLRSNGADVVDPTGTKFTMDSPEAIDVISKIHDLMYLYRVAPTPTQYATFSSPFTAGLLKDRRVAMVIDGQWNLLDLGEMGFKYGIGVLPKFQEPKTMNLCCALVLSKEPANLEKSLELLLFLADPTKNDLYSKGLWMPLQTKYYKDEAGIKAWTNNDVHPKGYKEAALDYLVNNAESEPAYRIKNWDQANNLLAADYNAFFTAKEGGVDKAKEVAQQAKSKVEPVLAGVYPDTNEG